MPGCLNNKSIITRELEGGNTFITICAASFGGGMEIIMKEQLRAWLYCRIDAPEDVHDALKGQKKELSDYAEQMGFTVVGSSEDLLNVITSDRPGWKRFMEAVTEGSVDVLLVYSLSRISRNICRTMTCLEQLSQSGVAVYSPLEGKLTFSFQKTMKNVISHSGFQQRSEGDM